MTDDIVSLLTIRHFERELLRMFGEGSLNGTTHTCLGQEYIPVALAPLLADDFVFSNHRGHGHYLARYRDPAGLLAEIMGREGAVCSGVGGSQHIHRDGYLSTGVQGHSLPMAVGLALRFRRAGSPRLAAAFIGDGTWGEGAVYEALNMAALWRLPVLVVVEDNGIAQSTPTGSQLAGTITDRAKAFGVHCIDVTTTDIASIRAAVAPVVSAVRDTPQPAVIRFVTHRLGPHSKGDDTRSASEIAALPDWYSRLDGISAIEERVRAEIAQVVADVTARPPARWSV